jgi:hypothetical protein
MRPTTHRLSADLTRFLRWRVFESYEALAQRSQQKAAPAWRDTEVYFLDMSRKLQGCLKQSLCKSRPMKGHERSR